MMVRKVPDSTPRAQYQKPVLMRVRLDIQANTLGVGCWNSTETGTSEFNGCNLTTPTCIQSGGGG